MHAIVMVHKMQRLALSSSSMDVDNPPTCPAIAEEEEGEEDSNGGGKEELDKENSSKGEEKHQG